MSTVAQWWFGILVRQLTSHQVYIAIVKFITFHAAIHMHIFGMSGFSGMKWNGDKLDTSNWFSPPYNYHF